MSSNFKSSSKYGDKIDLSKSNYDYVKSAGTFGSTNRGVVSIVFSIVGFFPEGKTSESSLTGICSSAFALL
jgi:hypothetical protein